MAENNLRGIFVYVGEGKVFVGSDILKYSQALTTKLSSISATDYDFCNGSNTHTFRNPVPFSFTTVTNIMAWMTHQRAINDDYEEDEMDDESGLTQWEKRYMNIGLAECLEMLKIAIAWEVPGVVSFFVRKLNNVLEGSIASYDFDTCFGLHPSRTPSEIALLNEETFWLNI